MAARGAGSALLFRPQLGSVHSDNTSSYTRIYTGHPKGEIVNCERSACVCVCVNSLESIKDITDINPRMVLDIQLC